MESLIGDVLREVVGLGALSQFQYFVAVIIIAFVIVMAKRLHFPDVKPFDPENPENKSPPMDMPEGGMSVPPPDHDYGKDP